IAIVMSVSTLTACTCAMLSYSEGEFFCRLPSGRRQHSREENCMFRNILVATGPSPWSSNAVDTAIRLAAYLRVELVIVHILEDDPQFHLKGPVPSHPELRAEREAAGQHMVRQAAERPTQAQVSHRTVPLWGGIPEQIVALAATNHCALIVRGTRH